VGDAEMAKPIEEDKLYEETGRDWQYYVSWREKIFAGYLTALAALAFAFSQNKSPAVLCLVFAFGFLVSVVFRILDFRTTELVNLCQFVGNILAGSKGFYGELNKARFDETKSTSEKKNSAFISHKLWITGASYALAINLLVAWVSSISVVGCIVEYSRSENRFRLAGGLTIVFVFCLLFWCLQKQSNRMWIKEKNKYDAHVSKEPVSFG
jgi:hypothetical protein